MVELNISSNGRVKRLTICLAITAFASVSFATAQPLNSDDCEETDSDTACLLQTPGDAGQLINVGPQLTEDASSLIVSNGDALDPEESALLGVDNAVDNGSSAVDLGPQELIDAASGNGDTGYGDSFELAGSSDLRSVSGKAPDSWSSSDFSTVLDILVSESDPSLDPKRAIQLRRALDAQADEYFQIFTDISYRRRAETFRVGDADVSVMYGCIELVGSDVESIVKLPFSAAASTCDTL